MSLLKNINEAANGKEETEGLDIEEIKKQWENAGSHRTPEKIYQLLLKMLGDEDKVIDAFSKIGIAFEKQKTAAEVLEPSVAKSVARLTMNMNAKEIAQLIQIVRTGKMPG